MTSSSETRSGDDRRQVDSNTLLAYKNRRDGRTGDRRVDPSLHAPDHGWRTRLARRLYRLVFREDLQVT